jgi:PIN domain nuclease of toxin-antitoxin system
MPSSAIDIRGIRHLSLVDRARLPTATGRDMIAVTADGRWAEVEADRRSR